MASAEDPPASRFRAAEAMLRQHWGYPGFRPGQQEVVRATLEGRDVLGILPTGGGKSICYQVPALLEDGLTLVVSPLIALMQDQVAQLERRGIPAAYINSTLAPREVDQRWTDAEFGRYRLLYVAPERLQTEVFRARAERLRVRRLAVDEAHCISEWGHHFRPAYLQIAEARRHLGGPPVLAVTATATPQVRRDILEHLALRDPAVFVKGFDRPNVVWSIFRTEHKRSKLLEVMRGVPGSGIVYAATRQGVERWAAWLERQGETAAAYHGGMAPGERERVQEAWIQGATRLVVATNAFGMGIDKPDVRFVAHVDVPASLEAYYQEAGRGGRDGRTAYAVLLFHPGDEATQQMLIEEGHPDAKTVRRVYDAACSLAQIPIGTQPEAPFLFRPDAVARVTELGMGTVRTAAELLARAEVWQVLPARKHVALIRFEEPADAVRRYADGLDNAALAEFVRGVLRTVHADAFSGWWDLDLRLLERRSGLGRERLRGGLTFLQERGLLRWHPPEQAQRLLLNEPRTQRLPFDDLSIRRDQRRAQARLDDILRYARSVTCRRHFLLGYFGEESPARCGRCDVCLGRHEAITITPDDEATLRHLLRQIAEGRPRAAWFDEGAGQERNVEGLLGWLAQEGYVRLAEPLAGTFALTEKAQAFLEQWAPRRS